MASDGDQSLYKVLVIGDYAVGKTSLIKQYVDGVFTPNYKLTIGVDFAVKELQVSNRKITLQLWDVAGHERFGTMTRVYYKYALAALIVFDLSRPTTFDAVLKWRQDINQKVSLPNGDPIPVILLANKCDIAGVSVDRAGLDEFVKNEGFLGWFETSAQDNVNVSEAIAFLVEHMVTMGAQQNIVADGTVDLGSNSKPMSTNSSVPDEQKSSCCG
eukprot:CAMPEP_0201483310 /NCGR_PEP_ID=MMETSP0151_2-20130828/7532_1 /ASSEMBLY_ACC=CAM_ASM_000257 /TAXON_ID=200890 /ORGANISM="Paramoeba atlantica, Strain 621/1 / CCAP 1560/9" /LENGTH=214 /DNA_ID=CAMNT_0047866399 /DNA_START=62 /DNA_END=706 /DNA_ORIENTATION=-